MTDDDNGNNNGDYNDHYNDDDTDGNYDLQTYVLHILLGGLVYPLTSPNLPPLFSTNLSITQLAEAGF